jgi:hypothetical protein
MAIKSATPKSSFINQTYTRIDKAWKSIQATEIINLKDLIDSTWSAIAKIWDSEHAYSEKRLVKVVDLAGQELANRIASEFKNSQLWVFEMETKVKLIEAVEVCRSFQRVGNLHQQQLFKRKANPLNFKSIAELESKLLTAIRIRTEIEELARIHRQSALEFDPESLLEILAPFNLLSLTLAQTKPFQEALDTVKGKIVAIVGQCIPFPQQRVGAEYAQGKRAERL